MRDIRMARADQTSTIPNKLNVDERQYASHAMARRLYAEVLLDAVVYATDVPEKFGPYEYGRRAISIPDNRVGNGFLDLFGRAKREIACECERSEETNVSMVLNLLNGGTLNGRITNPGGRVGRAVAANKPPQALIEEFYLATLSRRPDAKEQAAAQKLLSSAPNLKEGAEDLMWSLLNMREFLFNH
jgi:predicted DNA-binding transcriptional regulator